MYSQGMKKMADASKLILYSLSQTYNSLKLRKTTRQTCFHILSFFKDFCKGFCKDFLVEREIYVRSFIVYRAVGIPGEGQGLVPHASLSIL